jgi:hypothetical protein
MVSIRDESLIKRHGRGMILKSERLSTRQTTPGEGTTNVGRRRFDIRLRRRPSVTAAPHPIERRSPASGGVIIDKELEDVPGHVQFAGQAVATNTGQHLDPFGRVGKNRLTLRSFSPSAPRFDATRRAFSRGRVRRGRGRRPRRHGTRTGPNTSPSRGLFSSGDGVEPDNVGVILYHLPHFFVHRF